MKAQNETEDLRLAPTIRFWVEYAYYIAGSWKAAARRLEVSRTTLYRWREQWRREDAAKTRKGN